MFFHIHRIHRESSGIILGLNVSLSCMPLTEKAVGGLSCLGIKSLHSIFVVLGLQPQLCNCVKLQPGVLITQFQQLGSSALLSPPHMLGSWNWPMFRAVRRSRDYDLQQMWFSENYIYFQFSSNPGLNDWSIS